nr:macrophage immunometabolism regulator isoform X1 [Taeniopygia guttata]XP_030113624.3 macrophage immunometabolism regulator isoform X1 [Taeniopygia guttata]XP_041567090.1 macrophage immunometabolism regulator isoform X1 [Taeniopygia guttata]XP_041567091.1 macrophage immunometabolism regulator isoform X1 [Taeniopygia guttata]
MSGASATTPSPWGEGVKIDFFQPFRLDTAVFENVKFPLDAKDSIMLLLVLLCLLGTVCNMLRNKTLHSVVQQNTHSVMQCLLEEEETRSKAVVSVSVQNATTSSMLTQTVREEDGTKSKTTVSVSTQTVTEEETKSKRGVSMYTQTGTEEEGTKSAISISTQTITKPEQPEPIVVAPVQKKKSRSKSVCIVTDEDAAGPSHPAEETEPEIITWSLSLGELHDLRREFTHQTNESILTWLLCIWDAAANDTILDGSEARQLGSLSWDVIIDQGIGRTQETLSLWRQLLTSVRDRYLCKEDFQVHQGKWSTMKQGSRCLRELAVLEIIFSEEERFPKSPDCVQCTSQMWLRFARLGPEMYSRYLATLRWREGEDWVGVSAIN